MVFLDLTDMQNKVKIKSRIGKDTDKYEVAEYKPEEIWKGTDIKVVQLDYYHFFAIYCFSFPNSTQKVYFSMKQKVSEVVVVAPGNFYSFERKRNHMNILAGQNYEYQV